MFHLRPNYYCMFESSDVLFDLLSEWDSFFTIRKEIFLIPDTVIYL